MDRHVAMGWTSAKTDGLDVIENVVQTVGYQNERIYMDKAETSTIQHEIVGLENARCRALVEADIGRLDELVADDVVHVHGNGKVDDKAAYMKMMREEVRFLKAERDHLYVRVFGSMAVATGPLRQSIEIIGTGQRIDMSLITTQVWRRVDGLWMQASFQATNLPTEV